MAAAAADWSQAPADVLWNVIRRLPSAADHIRFGGVCVQWRSTLAEKRYGPARELPWLMLPGDGGSGTETNDGTVRFFSLTEKKDYRMCLPEIRDLRCLGSSEGFLIYVDEEADLHMLDPISGARVDLPSITTFFDILDVYRDSKGRVEGYMFDHAPGRYPPDVMDTDYIAYGYFRKVIVSPGSTPQNYTAVAIHSFCHKRIAFARAGDQAWNPIDIARGFTDVIFHNEMLYALNFATTVHAINLNHPSCPVFSLPGPLTNKNIFTSYLVMLSGGEEELFQVWRFVESFPTEEDEANERVGEYKTVKVLLYKIDSTSQKWVEVKTIGDHVLFLGHGHSVSFSTRDLPELKPNCIYFTDDYIDVYNGLDKFDMGVYDIEDGSMKPYYPPESILNWPPPIWFTPNIMRNLTGT